MRKSRTLFKYSLLSGLLVASLASCTNGTPQTPTIDPSLLPTHTPQVTTVPLEGVDQPVPGTNEVIEPVEVGEVLSTPPKALPDGFAAYETLDGEFVITDSSASAPEVVVKDAQARLQDIDKVEKSDDHVGKTVQIAWFEDIDNRMSAATGSTPVIIFTQPSAGVGDSKEIKQGWFFWSRIDATSTYLSQSYESPEKASQAALKWIDEQPNNAFIVVQN